MKIGVLGTGDVGKALSYGFTTRGHQVMIGTRDTSAKKIVEYGDATNNRVEVGTFMQAAEHGDALVLSVGWPQLDDVIEMAEPSNFDDKLVLDTTNPLQFVSENEAPILAIGHTDSAGEHVQRTLPNAKIVKAFNIVGYPHMVEPDFNGDKPDMFICGNDAEAKRVAIQLIGDLGWPPAIDLGDIRMSRYLEPMAMVWIAHFFNQQFNANHAFKLLRK